MDVQNTEHDLKNHMNDNVILLTSTDQPNSTIKHSPTATATAIAERALLHTPSQTKTLRHLSFPEPTCSIFKNSEKPQAHPTREPTSFDDDEDDDEWLDDNENEQQRKHWKWCRNNKVNKQATVEWVLFLIISTCLIFSLTIERHADRSILGLKPWKWSVIVLVDFCGRLAFGWAVALLDFLVECNFMLWEKVFYFRYGLWRSFQNCLWLGLVLIAWVILFPNVHRGDNQMPRRAQVAVLVAATI